MIRITPRAAGCLAVALGVFVAGCRTPEEQHSLGRLVEVTRRDIVVSAVAAGVIEPITTVEVKSKASGEIIEVEVEEGDPVRQGDLLVRVDPRIPSNAVVQAEADSVVARAELDNAEAQLERSAALRESQAITELEFEQARLNRATAYAALVRARRALEDAKIAYEDTEVRAPSDGVILGRSVEVGSVIASASRDVGGGAVLLRMATLDTVQIRALVDETDIGMVEPGLPVTIQVAAFPNRPFRGEVLRVGAEAVVDQNVTMFPVLARIANQEHLLRPGMNAEVEVHIGEVGDAVAVPNAALRPFEDLPVALEMLGLSEEAGSAFRTRGGEPVSELGGDDVSEGEAGTAIRRYVAFVVENGQPRPVAVRAGLTDFDYTAVLAGLEVGDSVLILPTSGLLEEQQEREQWVRERVGGPLGRTNR
ncbi:MAG: efflux RND transporter periplasmic adaptor subunit [Gemmatimonadales bacterium]